jgi:uncharacterized BrkB/YihY/UPF0761 family membrane protein
MMLAYLPPEALGIITDQIRKISQGEQGGLLTLGMLLALWSSSAAMTSISTRSTPPTTSRKGVPGGRCGSPRLR